MQNTLDDDYNKKHRRKHKNSRLGCPQCKQRRVKCDEELPACKKCTSRGTRCGYLDYTPQDIALIQRTHWEDQTLALKLRGIYVEQPFVPTLPVGVPVGVPEAYEHHFAQPHTAVQPPFPAPPPTQSIHPDLEPSLQTTPVPWIDPTPQFDTTQSIQLYEEDQALASEIQDHQYEQYEQPKEQNNYNEYQLEGLPDSEDQSAETSPEESDPAEGDKIFYPSPEDNGTTPESIVSSNSGLHGIIYEPEEVERVNRAHYDVAEESLEAYFSTNRASVEHGQLHHPVKTTCDMKPKRNGTAISIPLMPHDPYIPHYDAVKYPEYFGETISGILARVYLSKHNYDRFIESQHNPGIFDITLLFGLGRLVSYIPSLEALFLTKRGDLMRVVSSQLGNINDNNARTLLSMSSALGRTSVHLRNWQIKEHLILSWGPSAIIGKAFANPAQFTKSMVAMQRYADGLLYLSKSVYYPPYNSDVLVEFLEVVREFGEKFIKDEDLMNSDDPLVKSFDDLVEYLEYILEFTAKEKSNKHVLMYPVSRLYELLRRWFVIFPTSSLVVNSSMSGTEKVLHSIWYSLSFVLEAIFGGARYVFMYLFNGYYDIFILPREVVLKDLDPELRYYAHYFLRIVAFINRRRNYFNRNIVLNDPFPTFQNIEDRFKPRPLDIRELCITRFRKTVIRQYHYPMESTTTRDYTQGDNYYKGTSVDTADVMEMVDQFQDLDPGKTGQYTVDMLDFNEETCLLNKDYDPRYTDPIYSENVNWQHCDADFVHKYLEDRKIIVQLDD